MRKHASTWLIRLLAAVSCAGVSGCRTTHTERFAPPEHIAVEEAPAARAWTAYDGDAAIGRVIQFTAEARPDQPMFMIQNPLSQDLGMIDGLGRAWRFRPHQEEAEWLVTGTVAEGAAAILGASECTLREVSLESAREAAMRR